MKNQLLQGDALTILPTLEANSFDALITDPPYASGGLHAAALFSAEGEMFVAREDIVRALAAAAKD